MLAAASAGAQGYRIDWYSINSGGGVATSGAYTVNASIGQPVVGFTKNTSLLHWVGFWAGEVPTPTVAPSVASAKLLPDGTFVSVAGKIAISGEADFSGFFYVMESDRSGGIRVAAPASAVAGLGRGSVVNVIGTMSTTASGERQISGSIVIIASTAAEITPLGMPNRSIGGGDLGGQLGATGGKGLNNVGMLVKTWGVVTASGAGYIEVDDGSGPVRIDTTTLASQPGVGAYISVIGVSSLYKPALDRLPVVLIRDSADIRKQ